jgi:hypothetical protein
LLNESEVILKDWEGLISKKVADKIAGLETLKDNDKADTKHLTISVNIKSLQFLGQSATSSLGFGSKYLGIKDPSLASR